MADVNSIGSDGIGSCHDLLGNAIFSNPSTFGRLMVVSQLRDQQSGLYRHSLASDFDHAIVDRTLRRLHYEVFADWLNFDLQQQEKDISLWLSSLGLSLNEHARFFQTLAPKLDNLIPKQHLNVERQLFRADFEVLLILIGR